MSHFKRSSWQATISATSAPYGSSNWAAQIAFTRSNRSRSAAALFCPITTASSTTTAISSTATATARTISHFLMPHSVQAVIP